MVGTKTQRWIRDMSRKIIQCLICDKKYSVEDILSSKYFVDTLVCLVCYNRMQADKRCCFAKEYDASAEECSRFCPDRSICVQFVKGILPVNGEPAIPFTRKGSIIYRCFQLCMQVGGITKVELEKFVKRKKGNADRIYGCFRREEIYGKKWRYIETAKSVRIEFSVPGGSQDSA